MNPQQLGREMMIRSGDLKDDRQSCDWARIGQLLTQLGTPKMPKTMRDMRPEDKKIVRDAVLVLQAKLNKSSEQ
jgi:hypothetical protein